MLNRSGVARGVATAGGEGRSDDRESLREPASGGGRSGDQAIGSRPGSRRGGAGSCSTDQESPGSRRSAVLRAVLNRSGVAPESPGAGGPCAPADRESPWQSSKAASGGVVRRSGIARGVAERRWSGGAQPIGSHPAERSRQVSSSWRPPPLGGLLLSEVAGSSGVPSRGPPDEEALLWGRGAGPSPRGSALAASSSREVPYKEVPFPAGPVWREGRAAPLARGAARLSGRLTESSRAGDGGDGEHARRRRETPSGASSLLRFRLRVERWRTGGDRSRRRRGDTNGTARGRRRCTPARLQCSPGTALRR